MIDLPHAEGFDQTLAFLREGYRFIGARCDALGSDAFRARLMLVAVGSRYRYVAAALSA
jgi:fatty-acid peroxygenase